MIYINFLAYNSFKFYSIFSENGLIPIESVKSLFAKRFKLSQTIANKYDYPVL